MILIQICHIQHIIECWHSLQSDQVKYLGQSAGFNKTVYYKQADHKEWHDTVNVSGQDGQQFLTKNRSSYVRVHLCQSQLMPPSGQFTITPETTPMETCSQQNTQQIHGNTNIRPETD